MKPTKVRYLLVPAGIILIALLAVYIAPSVKASQPVENLLENLTTWRLNKQQGFIYGTVSIGPLCGIEPCDADPYLYLQDTTVKAFKQKRGEMILVGESSIDWHGVYEMKLPRGKYIINIDPNHWEPRCDGEFCVHGPGDANVPAKIKIKPQTVTRFNIDIDTGIR